MDAWFSFFALLTLTFLAAGLVKGVTGMGLPTVAMGVLGAVISPVEAAAMLVLPSFFTNLWQLFAGPATLALLRRLWPMMLTVVVGTWMGALLLVRANPRWSGLALGAALMVYAGYALVAPVLSVTPRLERWLAPLIGFVTGLVTGATGVFVMPAVPFLQALAFSKDELVQALGLSFSVSTLALASALVLHNAFALTQLGWSAFAIVPAFLGMWFGQKVRTHMSPRLFRQSFLWFLLVLGLELVWRALR